MEAGTLNKRLTFQTNTPTANSIGELTDTWSDAFTVWGAVKPLVGNRRYMAKQLTADVSGQVIIRYRDDVEPTMRIKYGSKYLYIISIVNPDERNKTLEVEYSEVLD